MTGLAASDVVSVSVTLTPAVAIARNLSRALILGSTPNIIDTTERMRLYSGDSALAAIASDFGTSAPEYAAAALYLAQVPRPASVYVGFFAQAASEGRLVGAAIPAASQTMSHFTGISAGSLKLGIDGSDVQHTAIDLSGAANLNAVATIVSTAFAGQATCVWNSVAQRFEIYSATTGASSAISFPETVSTGTDISAAMFLRQAQGSRIAAGSAVETALQGITACAAFSNDWYASLFAPVTALVDADHLAVAAFIETASPPRLFGITSSQSTILDSTHSDDIASLLKTAGYNRTLIQYSNTAHAVASLLGRALTPDFTGNNTAITLKFKNEPGVTAETITEAQAVTLTAKNCNVFVNYNNAVAIIQQGVMCGGNYIDEATGLDWLQNELQTELFNLLYTSPTKIPQTDAGMNQLAATAESVLSQAVANGLLAPGQWNAAGFGAIVQGQTLAKGYYIYMPPVASQSPADRAARKATTMQIAAKLAGAVHSANVLISVNR